MYVEAEFYTFRNRMNQNGGIMGESSVGNGRQGMSERNGITRNSKEEGYGNGGKRRRE